ncbi:MAG TPA: M18 family aminopeptidase [Candidatus Scybalomonas excrementigallinarum]|nr:M18 family aminopeptidase [Candidatus Scybalomonas excrementigallinarum]
MEQLMNFLDKSVSPYHAVEECKKQLEESGFEELRLEERWEIKAGGKYYVSPYPSMAIAITVGDLKAGETVLRIGMAHTDQPMMKIKPNAEMTQKKYMKLNAEKYGGLILNTWLDRPLGISGKVVLKSGQVFKPEVRFFDSKRPVLVIPNLAIHMNRDVNQGVALNPQTHMLPLFGLAGEEMDEHYFTQYIAKELGVKAEDILDYDLFAYNYEKSQKVGVEEELLLAPRIDNLASVYALLEGIKCSDPKNNIHIAGFFDHEEVGSRSKQGADSSLLSMVIERIMEASHLDRQAFMQAIAGGFMLSVDGAHALHPNYAEKNDPTTMTLLGDGVVIKQSGTQRYLSDSEATGILMQLCEKNKIPFQKQINRSDVMGGQTLGPIANAYLPMMGEDLGICMLAMHSSMETASCADCEALVAFAKAYYQE